MFYTKRARSTVKGKSLLSKLTMVLVVVFGSGGVATSVLLAAQQKQPKVESTTAGERSLPVITSQTEFESLARTYTDTAFALPHVLFVIDRKDNNRIYYVDSNRYKFHRDFVNGTYLSLERGQQLYENNYLKPNRRFIMGSLAFQTPIKQWTFEFNEGDLIPAELIKLTAEIVNRTFFTKVFYKPNSLRQEEASAKIANLERVLQTDITREQEYMALNVARGIGRIHIIDKLDENTQIDANEIIVLNEVPLHIPSVAGIIISKPSTPLSHVNLLAKSWGVPNAYIKNAHELLKQHDTWWVSFEATPEKPIIKRADLNQVKEYQERMMARRDIMTPRFDLSVKRIATLSEQRSTLAHIYGAKSANLGEVFNARLPGISVPNGFTLPIHYYDQFIKENNLEEPIFEMLNDQRFVHEPAYRRERLAEMRARLQAGTVGEQLRREVVRRVRVNFPGKGMFVRSSSNAEDLPNFNGAGLYDTKPNVRDERELIEAIKTVWASLWNFQAYEARERAGIDHAKVYMAVLIQEGIDAESAGVMITVDPYNRENKGAIYISAKRGIGIKVVEGERVAEQLIYRFETNTVSVLTRSAEDSLLRFDKAGGVREVPITGEHRSVLTDAVVRRLARTATHIKRLFGNEEQDIEWVFQRGRIYIVQSRPYIAGS